MASPVRSHCAPAAHPCFFFSSLESSRVALPRRVLGAIGRCAHWEIFDYESCTYFLVSVSSVCLRRLFVVQRRQRRVGKLREGSFAEVLCRARGMLLPRKRLLPDGVASHRGGRIASVLRCESSLLRRRCGVLSARRRLLRRGGTVLHGRRRLLQIDGGVLRGQCGVLRRRHGMLQRTPKGQVTTAR